MSSDLDRPHDEDDSEDQHHSHLSQQRYHDLSSNPHPYSYLGSFAHANPDLPSEPPGYDEFEFSYPSELSPAAAFFGMFGAYSIMSPSGSSLPNLSSQAASPTAWPPGDTTLVPPATIDGSSSEAMGDAAPDRTRTSSGGTVVLAPHARRESMDLLTAAAAAQDQKTIDALFKDEERHVLDAFFSSAVSGGGGHHVAADERSSGQVDESRNDEAPAPSTSSTSENERAHDATAVLSSMSAKRASPLQDADESPGEGQADRSETATLGRAGTTERANADADEGKDGSVVAADNSGMDISSEVNQPPKRPSSSKSPVKKARLSSDTPARSTPSSTSTSNNNAAAKDVAGADASPVIVNGLAGHENSVSSKRSNHIASEQRRRMTIKENYKALVDLLLAGEASSGISLAAAASAATEAHEDDDETGTSKGANSKPKGRGRGRKGQDGAGATKSVVLERAADYLRWLERTNGELEREITRLERALA